jgi:hypothetical protein
VSALCGPVGASEGLALPLRRILALAAVRAAQAHLDAIAHATDEHDERDVLAADLLDGVAELLSRGAHP